jgi:phosphopantothenoylcysteine decarboxylase/phosphopantothenate--cysteine ligase
LTGTRPFVVLGVSGGIAAYKAVELLRHLTESGHDVRVIPTDGALQFVGEPTWAALSGQPVSTDVWTSAHEVPHVQLGRQADLVVIAPATADLMARAASGRADDLLTATLLTARCPVVYAPAMHTEMWEHPATRANVALLRERGAVVIEPAVGRLTGADSGAGRLPDPVDIARVARVALARPLPRDLTGKRVLISAGGTREYLDPVRFLGNRSSGRQGYALALAAVTRGADVVLVSANVTLPPVAGARIVPVVSAEELRKAVLTEAADADVVVMAAAVADFRPVRQETRKIKKQDEVEPAPVVLTRTDDVLAELGAERRPGTVLVGFAAETDDVVANGHAKLQRKRCDLLVVNEVGEGVGFEVEQNAATILSLEGDCTQIATTSKDLLAHVILDHVQTRLNSDETSPR